MPLEEEANSGTLITFEEDENMEQAVISGIAFNRDEAKITVMGVPDKPGIAYQILGPVADANIDVDMIIQNQSRRRQDRLHVHRLARRLPAARWTCSNGRSRTRDRRRAASGRRQGVEGVGGRRRHAHHVGIASQMFRTLSEEGINIQMISTSEIKISVLIDEKYMELAVRALHKAFELDQA